MNVEIQFPFKDAAGRIFLTWRPVKAQVRLVNAPAGRVSISVRLDSTPNSIGARLSFADAISHRGSDTIDVNLPADGTPVDVWIGGKFNPPDLQTGSPASQAYGDISVIAREVVGGAAAGPQLGSQAVMIRVRKNAETLNDAERDLFLSAMAALNGKGTGKFVDFREMHNAQAYFQIHSNVSFLPWHRAYLLDFERELQVDFPEVSLPYWRFDRAAKNLFQPSFIGVSDGQSVTFSATNPLRNWVAEGGARGVKRGNGVDGNTVPRLRTEGQCMTISTGPGANLPDFSFNPQVAPGQTVPSPKGLEGDPHGLAHTVHGSVSWIYDPTQSQKDPLFYLLHNNIDRLWAKWQWSVHVPTGSLSDPGYANSYATTPGLPLGHNRQDTLWPWDGISRFTTIFPGPSHGPSHHPGGGLADSPVTSAPGQTPTVASMIDYLGAHGGEPLGFAYDDVPFES